MKYLKITTVILGLLSMLSCVKGGENLQSDPPPMNEAIQKMVELSEARQTLYAIKDWKDDSLAYTNTFELQEFINHNPSYKSYHVLFYVYFNHSRVFSTISNDTKAQIICSALAHMSLMDDWGTLGPYPQKDLAGEVLIETGVDSLKYLIPILKNKSRAFISGSSAATRANVQNHRKCDFAYKYACLLLGQPYTFERDILKRDDLIEEMLKKYAGNKINYELQVSQ